MKKLFVLCFALAIAGIAGCKNTSSPNSKIVAEVEAAGSGNLDSLDEGTIQNWLAKHVEVAQKIGPECGSVMKTATANWQITTEGRTCTAASKVLFFVPKKDSYKPY